MISVRHLVEMLLSIGVHDCTIYLSHGLWELKNCRHG